MDEQPYTSPADERSPITAELAPSEFVTTALLPRLWPTIVVGVFVIPVAAVISGMALLVAMAASGVFQRGMTESTITDWLAKIAESPGGVILLIVPGQLIFLTAAIAPALLSRVSFRQRLGLVSSRYSWWLYPLLMLATPLIGLLGSIPVMVLMEEPSEQLEFLYAIVANATGGTAFLILFLVSVVPGAVEELLFRGYLQRRLLQRWHPLLVILATSSLFAIAHVDPMHAAAVFPLGLWLGFIAWRTGSILPAIACHFFNNLLSLIETWVFGDPFEAGVTFDTPTLVTLGISATAFAASMIVFINYRDRAAEEPQRTETDILL